MWALTLKRDILWICATATVEREFGPLSGDNASLQLMRGFADSDGHIVGSGATSDHETNYSDSISSGHRRKVVIDGIFNRFLGCSYPLWLVYLCCIQFKARFPLPELTARVDGWPVSITFRQHGPYWRLMETGHPSTRVVETGLKIVQCTQYWVLWLEIIPVKQEHDWCV